MSKSAETASDGVPDEPQKNSVYDFLYCDTRRIGSYLSQFDDSGLLEKIIQRETASKGAKRGISLTLGGGATLAGTGGTGNVGLNLTPAVGGSEASERVYDPYWTNALTLLDFLEDAHMLGRDLRGSGIGQFVLVSGTLSIVDLSIAKAMFSNDALKKRLLVVPDDPLDRFSPNKAEQKHKQQEARNARQAQLDIGLGLMSAFPLTVQSTLVTSDRNAIWCTLTNECMTVKAGDLLLQHGVKIPGNWSIVGILDTKPTLVSESLFGGSAVSHSALDQPMSSALSQLAPAVRAAIGRPDSAYGITPLMIFRSVLG